MIMPTPEAAVTLHITSAGRAIERDSFATIDREAGPHTYAAHEWPVVRRMIHSSGDFDFNGLTQFHPQAAQAGVDAILKGGAPLLADVGMIVAGLSKARLAHFGMSARQYIDEPALLTLAHSAGTTIAVQAMRHAHKSGLINGSLVGIGNAPTALIEIVRLIREEGARPALVIGMPVGFVSAAESKELLASVTEVPWIMCRGRKGGSTLVVAVVHALLALAEIEQQQRLSCTPSYKGGAEVSAAQRVT